MVIEPNMLRPIFYNKKLLNKTELERIALIDINVDKIGVIQLVLFSSPERRLLYDATLGYYHNESVRQMVELLGGEAVLVEAIKKYPDIDFVSGVFALYECHCLTKTNFQKLIDCKNIKCHDVSYAIAEMHELNLLNQANFDFFMRHSQHASEISCGIGSLVIAGLKAQKYLDTVIQAGKKSKHVGSELHTLQEFGLLNEENHHAVTHRLPLDFLMFPLLDKMRETANQREY